MSKRNANGFGVIPVVLLVVLVGLVVFTGWYVWQAREDSKKPVITNFEECVAAGYPVMESYPEQCAADGQTFTNPNQLAPEPPSASSSNYLEIKEWGVKFKLTQGIEDATYKIIAQKNSPYDIAFLSTAKLSKISGCTNEDDPANYTYLYIERYKEAYSDNQKVFNKEELFDRNAGPSLILAKEALGKYPDSYKNVNNHITWLYSPYDYGCQALSNSIVDEFKEAYKSLQAL